MSVRHAVGDVIYLALEVGKYCPHARAIIGGVAAMVIVEVDAANVP
jgi:hypothetical protein